MALGGVCPLASIAVATSAFPAVVLGGAFLVARSHRLGLGVSHLAEEEAATETAHPAVGVPLLALLGWVRALRSLRSGGGEARGRFLSEGGGQLKTAQDGLGGGRGKIAG